MKNPSFRQAWCWVSLLLALTILFSTTQNSLAAPQPAPRGNTLQVLPLYVDQRSICVGQYENFTVLVTNTNMGNVSGATVHANNKTYTSGANGMARMRLKGEQVGQAKLTVYATKAGYNQSSSITMTINVVECSWNLRMDYNEAFSDTSYIWNFWGSVEIEDTPFTVNEDGSLALLTGQSSIQAQYRGSAYNLTVPMSCTPQPQLEGSYQIQFSGKYENGYLKINLSAIAAALPGQVTFHCIPVDPNYTIADWNYPTGQKIDLINAAKLTSIFCPAEGCVKRFKLSRVQMWPFTTALFASGVLIIEKEIK